MEYSDSDLLGFINFISKYSFEKTDLEQINKDMLRFLNIYSRKHGVEHIKELRVHVKEYHMKGKQKEYELEALFLTNKEHFHAEKKGWDAVEVASELMDALKRQIEHRHEHAH